MRAPHLPLQSILIKPAGPDCNLDCDYCFYLKKDDLFPENKVHRMPDEILKELLMQVLSQTRGDITFAWQGGEPTLMGLPFFKNAVRYQQQYAQGHRIGNGFQTNGVLLDAEWAAFLKEYRFLIGLSLDGPEHIHDHYRVDKGGRGSFKDVRKAAELLLQHDVAVNALVVVNDYSVRFPEEIYAFHKELGLNHMQFIPCVEVDHQHQDLNSYTVDAEAYGDFLCKTFDLWTGDIHEGVANTSVRFFDSLFHTYVGMGPGECTLLADCGNYLTVEHDGSVYSCDFYVEKYWHLGNIMENQLIQMLNSEHQIQFGSVKSKLPQECLDCEWLEKCRGGCPKDRIEDGTNGDLHFLCSSFKKFFTHADPVLQDLAGSWQVQQRELARMEQTRHEIQMSGVTVGRNDLCPCGSGRKFKKCCGA